MRALGDFSSICRFASVRIIEASISTRYVQRRSASFSETALLSSQVARIFSALLYLIKLFSAAIIVHSSLYVEQNGESFIPAQLGLSIDTSPIRQQFVAVQNQLHETDESNNTDARLEAKIAQMKQELQELKKF